jgi:hypothetical protein
MNKVRKMKIMKNEINQNFTKTIQQYRKKKKKKHNQQGKQNRNSIKQDQKQHQEVNTKKEKIT